MRSWTCSAALLAASLGAEDTGNVITWGPLSLSRDNALQNMEEVHKFIQGIYYSRAPQARWQKEKKQFRYFQCMQHCSDCL